MIPYGKQFIDDSDIKAVTDVLRSDFITTGPAVSAFENNIMAFTDTGHAVAVSSGTAALHAIMFAIGIGPGDEVIVPAITFAATSNAVLYQDATPVFADVLPDTLLIDPASVETLIGPRTKAVVAVDYGGQPCNYEALRKITDKHGIYLISDACHSLGAEYHGVKVGGLADMTALSFHPVKQMTTGEGGMVLTNSKELSERARLFRNHGISTDYHQREKSNSWFYEMIELGYNYRITDFQCALGSSQLKKLPEWIVMRRKLADFYDNVFAPMKDLLEPLKVSNGLKHSYHLYVLKIADGKRDMLFQEMRKLGIGVNVHYVPLHLHPYYAKIYGPLNGLCPVAESVYKQIISIPMYPFITDEDRKFVVDSIYKLLSSHV